MQCLNCGTTNPDSARYCFECGTALTKPLTEDHSNFIFCSKCNASNPQKGRFCYECGNPLLDTKQPEPLLCPTCGISIDTSRLFCPNCGQSLIGKPLDLKKEQLPVSPKESQIECPACGQLTTGDYCRSCGYNLTTRKRKRPIDWWYCDRDSALMTEINPNFQILVSRNSLNESLAQAISDNILQYQDREKARFLALQLFENNNNAKFEVLSQVRCPVCSQQSLAPTTKQPSQIGIHYTQEIALNVSSMLQSGIFYIRTYPKFLLIAFCGVIIDTVLLFLGFGALSTFSPNSLLSIFGVPLTGILPIEGFSFSLTTFILALITSYLVNIFIQCWYYTSLKDIASNIPFDLVNSFKKSFSYFPRAFAAQLLIFGGIIGFAIGFLLIFIVLAGILFSGSNSQILLFVLFILIIGIFGLGAFVMLLNVLLSYVNMSIVFDEKSGIILSLKHSWRFARKYFWTTVGIIVIFSVGSYIVGYIQTFSYLFFYLAFLPSLISLLIYTILTRLIEVYKALSMGWGYQTFHHLIN
ncbi:MAG: zinc ribbon domain-containing protein [Candidatus Thorarchaeota archaeon]